VSADPLEIAATVLGPLLGAAHPTRLRPTSHTPSTAPPRTDRHDHHTLRQVEELSRRGGDDPRGSGARVLEFGFLPWLVCANNKEVAEVAARKLAPGLVSMQTKSVNLVVQRKGVKRGNR